jgi:hypothetical protein
MTASQRRAAVRRRNRHPVAWAMLFALVAIIAIYFIRGAV